MILSNVGVMANVFWYEIKNHSKNVELGEFVVMPNQVHGILILNGNDNSDNNLNNVSDNIEIGHALSLQSNVPLNEPLNEPSNEQTIGQQ